MSNIRGNGFAAPNFVGSLFLSLSLSLSRARARARSLSLSLARSLSRSLSRHLHWANISTIEMSGKESQKSEY